MPISIKIDCTLITKSKLFKGSKKNAEGKDPMYLDIILIETPNNKYAQYMAVEALSKEEKDRGMRQGKKLGEGKNFGRSSNPTTYTPPNQDRSIDDYV